MWPLVIVDYHPSVTGPYTIEWGWSLRDTIIKYVGIDTHKIEPGEAGFYYGTGVCGFDLKVHITKSWTNTMHAVFDEYAIIGKPPEL